MSEDVATLGYKVETRGLDDADKKLVRLGDTADKTSKNLGNIGAAGKKTRAGLASLSSKANTTTNDLGRLDNRSKSLIGTFSRLKGLIAGGLFALVGGTGLVGMIDEYKNVNSLLAITTKSQEDFNRTQKELFKLSQDNFATIDQTTRLYAGQTKQLDAMGYAHTQQIKAVDLFSKALVTGGASVTEATSTTLQYIQGLSSGVIRGQEFNSIMENGRGVAYALADGLGVGIGKLRTMALEGKLTAKTVVDALLSQESQIRDKFSKIPITVGRAWTLMTNSVTRAVARVNEKAGDATGSIANLIKSASKFVDNLDLHTVAVSAAALAGVLTLTLTPAILSTGAALTVAFATNPFTLIASAVVVAATSLSTYRDEVVTIGTSTATVGDFVVATWDYIKESVGNVVNNLSTGWDLFSEIVRNDDAPITWGERIAVVTDVVVDLGVTAVETFKQISARGKRDSVVLSAVWEKFKLSMEAVSTGVRGAFGVLWAYLKLRAAESAGFIAKKFAGVLKGIGKGFDLLPGSLGKNIIAASQAITDGVDASIADLKAGAAYADSLAKISNNSIKLEKQKQDEIIANADANLKTFVSNSDAAIRKAWDTSAVDQFRDAVDAIGKKAETRQFMREMKTDLEELGGNMLDASISADVLETKNKPIAPTLEKNAKAAKAAAKAKKELDDSNTKLSEGLAKTLVDLEEERLKIGKNELQLYQLNLEQLRYGKSKLKMSEADIAHRVQLKANNIAYREQIELEEQAKKVREDALKTRKDALETMAREQRGWELGFKLIKGLTEGESKNYDIQKKAHELKKAAIETANKIADTLKERSKEVALLTSLTVLSANAVASADLQLQEYTESQAAAQIADEKRSAGIRELARLNDDLEYQNNYFKFGKEEADRLENVRAYGEEQGNIISQREKEIEQMQEINSAWDNVADAIEDAFKDGKLEWESLRDALREPLSVNVDVAIKQAAGDIQRDLKSVFDGGSIKDFGKSVYKNIGNIFNSAGTGINGAINSFGIGGQVAGFLGADANTQLGASVGAALGSFIPGLGNMLGSLIGATITKVFNIGQSDPELTFTQGFQDGQGRLGQGGHNGNPHYRDGVFGGFGATSASNKIGRAEGFVPEFHKMLDQMEDVDQAIAAWMPDSMIDRVKEGLKGVEMSGFDLGEMMSGRLISIFDAAGGGMEDLIDKTGSLEEIQLRVADIGVVAKSVVPVFDDLNFNLGHTRDEFEKLSSITGTGGFKGVIKQTESEFLATLVGWGDQLKVEGETASTALIRSAQSYAAVTTAAGNLGMSFKVSGLAALEASNRVIELAGGINEFGSKAEFVYQNFFTESERTARSVELATQAIAEYNDTFDGLDITSANVFAEIVKGADLSTEAGREQYAAMLAVSESVFDLYGAVESATDATETLTNNLISLADAQRIYDSEILGIDTDLRDATATINELGIAGVNVRQQFVSLINSLEIGSDEYNNAIRYAESIDVVADAQDRAAQEQRQAAEEAARAATQAREAAADALNNVVGLINEIGDLFDQVDAINLQISQGPTSTLADQIRSQIDAQRDIISSYTDQIRDENSRINDLNREQQSIYSEALRAWETLQSSVQSGRDYLDSLLLDQNITNLTPAEQLVEVQAQYQAALADQDVSTAQSALQDYLGLARDAYGSTDQYDAILASSTSAFDQLLDQIEAQPKPIEPVDVASALLPTLIAQQATAESQLETLQAQLAQAQEADRVANLESDRIALANQIRDKMSELDLALNDTLLTDLPDDIRLQLNADLEAIRAATDNTQLQAAINSTRDHIDLLPPDIKSQLDPNLSKLLGIESATNGGETSALGRIGRRLYSDGPGFNGHHTAATLLVDNANLLDSILSNLTSGGVSLATITATGKNQSKRAADNLKNQNINWAGGTIPSFARGTDYLDVRAHDGERILPSATNKKVTEFFERGLNDLTSFKPVVIPSISNNNKQLEKTNKILIENQKKLEEKFDAQTKKLESLEALLEENNNQNSFSEKQRNEQTEVLKATKEDIIKERKFGRVN